VAQLRTRGAPIQMAQSGAGAITLRVELADLWETVRVVAKPETPVAEVKQRVIAAFFPGSESPGEFMLKLRGWEVLDERASLASSGVVDGSILLLAYRRRRPLR
jgi:hypothetical protein